MASSESKLDDILLGELECPVCLEYMLPPITLCENGHNICNMCRPQLEICPTCMGVMTNTRSITVEKMVQHLEYPCMYSTLGCQQTFPIYLIADHHALCQFSTYKCPVEACEWKGTCAELCTHVLDIHIEEVLVHDNDNLMVFSDYNIDTDYKRIIISNEQVFVALISAKNNIWNFVLQCVNSKEISSTCEYTFTFSKSGKSIKVTHFTQSIKENLQDVYESCKCVKLPVEVVKDFIIEKDLFCFLEIKKLS